MKLAAITDHLQDSQILSISNRIKQRILAGEKMYNLTVGDFDPTIFPIPELLEEYIHEAYRNKYTNYPPSDGLLELREGLAPIGQHLLDKALVARIFKFFIAAQCVIFVEPCGIVRVVAICCAA